MSPPLQLLPYEVAQQPRRRRALRLWAWAKTAAVGLAALALFSVARWGAAH